MEKPPAKTESELIATVANIQDAERCVLFAQRALKAGMPALATACEERAKMLKPVKPARHKKKSTRDAVEVSLTRAEPIEDREDAEVAAS